MQKSAEKMIRGTLIFTNGKNVSSQLDIQSLGNSCHAINDLILRGKVVKRIGYKDEPKDDQLQSTPQAQRQKA